jgi:protein-S-isoprenylcysteine O-methyltransferase Ste14
MRPRSNRLHAHFMITLENKIPPLLVAALVTAAMWTIPLATQSTTTNQRPWWPISIIAFSLGVFFCAAGVVSFKLAKTTVDPLKPDAASSLVRSGIYRFSRNPMYVGFALLLIAWAAYLGYFLSLAGVIAFVFYMNRFQIVPEERALAAKFPAEFAEYRLKVRRWL